MSILDWRGAVTSLLVAGFAMTVSHAWAGDVTIKVTNSKGQPVADAIVMLKAADGSVPQTKEATNPKKATISQRSRQYQPRVSVVQKGTSVSFVNEDPYGHHVYSFSRTKRFELLNPSGEESGPIVMDKSGVVPLGCNIHDKMLAYLYVADTPLFSRTDEQGQATIPGLPAGTYKAQSWHPNSRTKVKDTETEVSIVGDDNAELKVVLDIRAPRKRGKGPGFGGSRYR